MKHGFTLVGTTVQQYNNTTAQQQKMERWKSSYFLCKTVTLLQGLSMMCCLWRETIGLFLFTEMVTAERYWELIMNFIALLAVEEQTAGFNNMRLRHTGNWT
jgi:hypothetical protein